MAAEYEPQLNSASLEIKSMLARAAGLVRQQTSSQLNVLQTMKATSGRLHTATRTQVSKMLVSVNGCDCGKSLDENKNWW
jgi:hypothetical protein